MAVEIRELRDVTGDTVAGLAGLLGQLSTTAAPLSGEVLQRVVDCPSNTVLVAEDTGVPLGMLTLVVFPIPTGLRAWLEDVVVDGAARGRGVGTQLVEEAVRRAVSAGARSVDLTSRPSRAAANRLYERLGFQLRESTVYRYTPG